MKIKRLYFFKILSIGMCWSTYCRNYASFFIRVNFVHHINRLAGTQSMKRDKRVLNGIDTVHNPTQVGHDPTIWLQHTYSYRGRQITALI